MANLYHDASLILKPSYVEDGRILSMVPEDGTGDMYFEREGYGASVACLLYTSPSPRDGLLSRMPSSA